MVGLEDLRPKRPRGPFDGWEPIPLALPAGEGWRKGRTFVVSQFATTRFPDESGEGPHWIVSISQKGSRCAPDSVCKAALRQFGMAEAFGLEDNHAPGISRCFFLPVDEAQRLPCHCQTDEAIVTEPSGRRWAKKLEAT